MAAAVSRLDLKRSRIWLKLPDLDSPATSTIGASCTDNADTNTTTTTTTIVVEQQENKKTTSTAIENGFFDSDDETPNPLTSNNNTINKNDKKILNTDKIKENHQKLIEVEMDLTLSAYANARKMYINKKIAYNKEIKTVEAANKVLQNVSNRVQNDMENQNLKRNLKAVRKVILSLFVLFL